MKKPEKVLPLPEGFKQDEHYSGPRFEDGEEILFQYCRRCVKRPDCKKREYLGQAMGENFPFWSEDFLAIDVPITHFYRDSETHVMCRTYRDRQLKLKGMRDFLWPDSIRRLVDVTADARSSRDEN